MKKTIVISEDTPHQKIPKKILQTLQNKNNKKISETEKYSPFDYHPLLRLPTNNHLQKTKDKK
jgi:hypothetical protein